MADTYLIDGTALAPTCFGEYDANGYWRPKPYSTGTPCAAYGTNGFHLDFANGSALGTDTSGNSNTWTVNNLASTDQVTDSPTNSFATLSSVWNTGGTLAKGNLLLTGSGTQARAVGTIALSGGKYCFEATKTDSNAVGNEVAVGVHAVDVPLSTSAYAGNPTASGGTANEWVLTDRDYAVNNTTYTNLSGTLSNIVTNTVVQVCVDMTVGAGSNKIWFGVNNTFSGSPSAGTGAAYSNLPGTVYPLAFVNTSSGDALNLNFGQGATTTVTYDSVSGGSFRYTLPSGFKALSTANLPEPTIVQPKNYFDAIAYAGNGGVNWVLNSVFASTTVVRYTSSGTWTVPAGVTSVNYLVVAGGGGGGYGSDRTAGGGGAGGVRTGMMSVTPGQSLTVTVGAGGTGGSGSGAATAGGDSVFGSVTSTGGGRGGASGNLAGSGGSGGGRYHNAADSAGTGAAGQGNNGGPNGYDAAVEGGIFTASGGGGAGAVGSSGTSGGGGAGGAGTASSITGSSVTYAGGGGGGGQQVSGGAGGAGGGGAGGTSGTAGTAGTANTGGGGGGGSSAGPSAGAAGGNGGSGVVIIAYTAAASSISSFAPSLVWIKDRTSANAHGIFDSVRGTVQSFTSTGTTTWTASAGVTSVDYLVVAGGGGGGSNRGGGGGAGGFQTGTLSVTPGTSYTVVVGAGGAGGAAGAAPGAKEGGQSVFSSIISLGGGYGSGANVPGCGTGGSGGGISEGPTGCAGTVGQGNNGGDGFGSGSRGGGGGGGASAVGANGTSGAGGNGGAGTASSITGTSITYAGGGGGAVLTSGTNGTGGAGGGGNGNNTTAGVAGTANTGGGGGAGGSDVSVIYAGGAGGSGIVVLARSAGSINFPYWSSNANTAETNSLTAITAFLSNGFSLGTNALFNTSGNNYISWMWKESPTAGMDIVSYTGTGVTRTVNHSLSTAPEMIIVKNRSSAFSPVVYHTSLDASPQSYRLLLDSTAAKENDTTTWVNAPTGSVFSVGSSGAVNESGKEMIAYLFKGIEGFSKFGTYTGNGSADGPFVYTGFKPRYVMIKRTDSTSDWYIWDTARDSFNVVTSTLLADTTGAETSATSIDVLSNGFKARSATVVNVSTATYIYAAFAEIPFKYSASTASLIFVQAVAFLLGMTF